MLTETEKYLEALKKFRSEEISLLKVKRGGRGKSDTTWFHPKLGVPFARWLDVDFAVWCDDQIDSLLRGTHDWKRLRHEASCTFKAMNKILQRTRRDAGKETAPHHFSNEARLVNWALSGEFKGIDRETLPISELDLLASLEEENIVLIGSGKNYEERKTQLNKFADDWRLSRVPMLKAA